MLNKRIVFLLLSGFFFAIQLYSQSVSSSKLGLDSRLYNGKYYSYFLPQDVDGNQFFNDAQYSEGIVWIDNNEYNNLLLNYDILNQELALSFTTKEGANQVISISKAKLDSFYFDKMLFVVNDIILDKGLIFQKIEAGNNELMIQYYKELKLRSTVNRISYEFTKVKRKVYYHTSTGYNKITNNKAFIKYLNTENKTAVKKYMKSKKYKILKMNNSEYLDLLRYIDNEN